MSEQFETFLSQLMHIRLLYRLQQNKKKYEQNIHKTQSVELSNRERKSERICRETIR